MAKKDNSLEFALSHLICLRKEAERARATPGKEAVDRIMFIGYETGVGTRNRLFRLPNSVSPAFGTSSENAQCLQFCEGHCMSSNDLPVWGDCRQRVGRQVCICRPCTALGFNKIPLSIFATRSEGWAHTGKEPTSEGQR